jgi:uncharacterized protein (TIGR02996 family)
MTDGEALFAAVLREPDEDTPRLVYADWLEENDQAERAEFIRVQVELARAPTSALFSQQKTLLARYEDEWLAPLRAPGQPLEGGAGALFRRGFVEVVWTSARRFLEKAGELFAVAPVRELRVTRANPEEYRRLMNSPRLARLRGLDLSDRRLGDDVVWGLLRSQFSPALRELRLRGCGITDVGAVLFTGESFARRLRELDLSHNPISTDLLDVLRERYGDVLVAEGGLLPPGAVGRL